MTRVLFVSTFLSATANRGYTEDLVDRLEARGHGVLRTSRAPGRAARLVDMVRTAIATRARYDVAVVDVFSGAAFVWAEAVCFTLRRLGKPYILTLHGGNLPAFAARWPLRVRRLLASAARVTSPSGYLREQLHAARSDITVLPNAIDTAALRFDERTRARPRLIWVRAFHAVYNPVMAVEAIAQVRRTLPDVALAMIGPDKGDGTGAAVAQRIAALDLANAIDVVGPVPKAEVPARLAGADILVNTTNVDNTPISMLEAMAQGLCIVSTNVGGVPYLVRDGESALLVPPGDAAAMARAIERLVREPALAVALSQRAHEIARAHDWVPVLAGWDALLAEVARA